ncbi:MAG: hypothetical protein IKO55_06195, partial [Kiritimatiellae bacterium]|nr:hypothetical protein [Kiritimatiellia bacterium]
ATPFFNIVFDANGRAGVKFWPMRDGYEGVKIVTEIFATTDLHDFAKPDMADWTGRIPMAYDIASDTWKPADGIHRPAMFFKWRVDVVRVEEE